MGAVDRDADAAAHDNAVDERHIGLAIAFDAGVERVFLAKIAECLVVPSGAPHVVGGRAPPARGGRRGLLAGARPRARPGDPPPIPRAAAPAHAPARATPR